MMDSKEDRSTVLTVAAETLRRATRGLYPGNRPRLFDFEQTETPTGEILSIIPIVLFGSEPTSCGGGGESVLPSFFSAPPKTRAMSATTLMHTPIVVRTASMSRPATREHANHGLHIVAAAADPAV